MANAHIEAAVKHSLNGAELAPEQFAEVLAYAEKVGIPQYMDESNILRAGGFAAFKDRFIK